MNKVWNIHLSFTKEQFAAMKPYKGKVERKPGTYWLQGSEGKRNGSASALGWEFNNAMAELEFEGVHIPKVAVRVKGNGTFTNLKGSEKTSLKIDFGANIKGQKFAGVSVLNLHNQLTDSSYMNEVLSYWLFRKAGAPASRTAYGRVYISVHGRYDKKYLGLYVLTENVDQDFIKDRFGAEGGALFKPVTDKFLIDQGPDWKHYNQAYDPKGSVTTEQKDRVLAFARLVSHATDQEFQAKLGAFLDVDAFAKYMAVMMMLVNLDSILINGQNFYMYLDPRTNLFQFIPWDKDTSFGQSNGRMINTANLSIDRPWGGTKPFLDRVYATPSFQRAYKAKLDEFTKALFEPALFARQVDLLAPILRQAVKEESAWRLRNFDLAAAGKPYERSGYQLRGPARAIKEFTASRQRSLIDQLTGRAVGEIVNDFYFRN
jgi:spore coat protein CotH